MKRTTMIGLFVGMFSLTMNAQSIQSNGFENQNGSTNSYLARQISATPVNDFALNKAQIEAGILDRAEDHTINATLSGHRGPMVCFQSHPISSGVAGAGSSVDSNFKSAVDIEVLAGENFRLETIDVPFLTFAPIDPPTTANIVYYTDSAGFPGTVIGNETVVPIVTNSATWINPLAIKFDLSLPITPFYFFGNASTATTFWIEISVGTATSQGTVFWECTNDVFVNGSPLVQYDASIGTWSVLDAIQEGIYNFGGWCEYVGDGSFCPQPTFLTVTNITDTTAELNWATESNAVNGYIWYVFEQAADPTTATPVSTGTTPSGTITAVATGMAPGTSYDSYVVADCGIDGLSPFAGPVNFVTDTVIGIDENVFSGFSFHPNPASQVIHLNASKDIETIVVYNLLGQKMMDGHIGSVASELDVSSLAIGTYILKVIIEGQTGTYRIVKK